MTRTARRSILVHHVTRRVASSGTACLVRIVVANEVSNSETMDNTSTSDTVKCFDVNDALRIRTNVLLWILKRS